ncbi:MAG: MmcQ/YjbR family DNA-binding protein [Prevotella sp.]|nr:MmcQ/YjbR family DNA-binding protein [Prevotella sp.]
MNVEEFRDYCLSLPCTTEKMPFTTVKDPYSRDILCFYVGTKWFCYVNIEVFDRCCVKNTPERASELRESYEGVRPAWHMNKRRWSDVYFSADVPDAVIKRLVRESYDLVLASLKKSERAELLKNDQ